MRVIKRTTMRDQPSALGARVRMLMPDTELTPTGKKQVTPIADGASEEWTEAKFIDANLGASDQGWVLSHDIEDTVAVRPAVDQAGFVIEAIAVERVFNSVASTAPWLVSANYMIARALIETGITNSGPKLEGSDGVGPLQVSTAEWKLLMDTGNTYGTFTDIGRDGSISQLSGAAFLMHRDAQAISDAAKAKGVGSDTDPYVPSLLDVHCAYILNSPTNGVAAATAVILAQRTAQDAAKSITDVLTGILAADQIGVLFKTRGKYLGTSTAPNTVAKFVAAVDVELSDALKKAYELMQQFAPEELMQVSGTEASWFDVALEEEQKDVKESDPTKVPIILNYFGATSLRTQQRMLPWCGAFAAFCMQKSGNPVPAEAAAARSWKNWGVGLELGSQNIPQGAVVVISPSDGTGTTGHVAFFVQIDPSGKTVQLLGGNQHDMLKRSSFPISKIAAIRWIDSAPAAAAEQFQAVPSTTRISPEAIQLIIDSEVSGEAAYDKRYRGPTWPGLNSGVTIGIGYDVGQTSAAAVRADWSGLVASGDITGDTLKAIVDAAGIKGQAARERARALRGQVDVPYKAAMKVFAERDIPRWTSLVERALGPHVSSLHPHCLGALVSLAYNRGPSFGAKGDRYKEMNEIKACVAKGQFDGIPGQFRNMKRLWPNLRGLQIRRDAEADLFQRGLSARPVPPPPPPTGVV
jgi:uncharacterized protein (TIGR02594 family)